MSDYTVTFDGAGKDALATGNASKVAKGADLDVEFDAIAVAINSKYDSADALLADIDGMTQDPGADRILFWDNSASPAATTEWLTVTNGLEISTTNLGIADSAAGAGLAASSGVLSLDFNELGAETTHASGDSLMMIDATDNGSQKITIDNFLINLAGVGIEASTNTLILNLNELTTDTAVGSGEYVAVYTDGSKKITLSNLATSIDGLINIANLAGYDANKYVDHTGVSISTAANSGLAGGGTIASTRSLTVDVSNMTALSATAAVDLDVDLVCGDDGGTDKKITCASLITPEMGTVVSGTSDTLAETDFGKVTQYSSTSTVTITLPNGLKTGFWAVLQKTGASGTINLSATTTLNTENSATSITAQYGVVTVFHTGSNVWTAWGSLV